MSFIHDVPNYKTLESDIYYTDKLPDDIWDEFHAYAARTARKIGTKKTVNILNDIVLLPPTTNWGESFLQGDLDYAIRTIKNKGDFPLAMDAILTVVQKGRLSLDEINGWLLRNEIGYFIAENPVRNDIGGFFASYSPCDYHWKIREKIDNIATELENTSAMVKSVSQQALEHLEQAIIQLENIENERARKDAVRDCASAMEAIIKQYGKINDIGDATKELRSSGSWGKDEIVKEGNSIFNTLHRLYPDLRHGSTEFSEMTKEEAIYWVDRIMAYVKYMIRKGESLGVEKGAADL